ncbi:MAG: ribonuclease P protein component [bacterium]|nr:ribonuclease P protein component [bacterium]
MAPELRHTRYRLPASLSGKAEFDRVFRNGKRYRHAFLQLIISPAEREAEGKIGFVIPDKSVKKSSRRNRIKRLLREAVRHWWMYLNGGHYFVFRVFDFPEFDHALYVESVFLKLLLDSGILTNEGRGIARETIKSASERYPNRK